MTQEFVAQALVPIKLDAGRVFKKRAHLFEQEDIDAVRCALLAKRPLLLTGEPGTGKSQFAEAVAKIMECAYIPHVLDSKTEPRDLFYEIDHVRRLAEAQVRGGRGAERRLELRNFLRPGPLWWAFSWETARRLPMAVPPKAPAGWDETKFRVLLLDEIDKVATDVANGLLEALGDRRFVGPAGEVVEMAKGVDALIVLATNGERDLPDALVRRCLVHRLVLKIVPGETEPREFLKRRGEANFAIDHEVLGLVISRFLEDRKTAKRSQLRAPGLAEFMDMLHVLEEAAQEFESSELKTEKQKSWLESSRKFLFHKSEQVKVEE